MVSLTKDQKQFAQLLTLAPPTWDENIVAQAESDAALYRACHDHDYDFEASLIVTESDFREAFGASFVPTTFRENGQDLRGDLADVWLRLNSAETEEEVMAIINGEIIPNIPNGWGITLLSDMVRACERVGGSMDMSRLKRADAMDGGQPKKRKRFVS